ncbi:MAG: protein kinase [Acidobacteriales bacterium]|nr:protein kinase [Terriglobales bacterium]
MTLAAGTKLGPYEIVSPLGAGGMGEVYRARDTRLDRVVAIKILPPHLSSDSSLKQRFEREAKLISSLNHPHICVLHDIGTDDGTVFLVMECVEGETLAKRLEKGPLPLAQVLKYGMQIADALDRAHRSGVVHRDLKPGNIMLTASGAKLLDFGLAKTALPSTMAAAMTTAATGAPITERGFVVGTFQYMSPEQVEGKDIDARSDIFSFGSVLYEMVTGKPAFQGKSQISVASAILEKDPEPVSKLQPLTPPALDHAIRVCLAKDPDERWQSARDLLVQLKWIQEAGSQAGVPFPLASHRKLRERLAWASAAVFAVLAITSAIGYFSRSLKPQPLIRLNAELPAGALIDRYAGSDITLSPDGTRIVVNQSDLSGKFRLVMRKFDQDQFVPLSGAEGGYLPFFSPDSQWIAFFVRVGDMRKLKKMPASGGSSSVLCDVPIVPRGGSWGDDGTIVIALNEGATGLARVSSDGGTPTPITQLNKEKGETSHAWPQILPGSQAALFTAYAGGAGDDAQIEVASLKTGERKVLHTGGRSARYLASGHLAFLKQNTLFVAPMDLERLALAGPPRPMLEDVSSDQTGQGDFDSSATGILAHVSSKASVFRYQIFWLDSAGQSKLLHAAEAMYENPRLSPDGKRLAFELANGPMQADIWVKDLERDTTSRLTHLPGRNNHPVWTPDGKAIIFASYFRDAPGMFWIRADGVGEAQRLTQTDNKSAQSPSSITPDGKRLAYYQWGYGPRRDIKIWTAPIEGPSDHPSLGKAEPLLGTQFTEWTPVFSRDGRWVAYSSDESGIDEIYVRPFPGPGSKTQISTGGGNTPLWSRNRRQLFFLTKDLRIMVADYSIRGDAFLAGKPRVWSQRQLAFMGSNYSYDQTPDGKRFAVVMNAAMSPEQAQKPMDNVIVLLNFFDELRRKVPAGKN